MNIAIGLPGLATHFNDGGNSACCGVWVPASRLTSDPRRVDCRRCLRTKLHKTVRAALRAAAKKVDD